MWSCIITLINTIELVYVSYIWANCTNSLTWNKAISGMIPPINPALPRPSLTLFFTNGQV